jgi:hypothetical protein
MDDANTRQQSAMILQDLQRQVIALTTLRDRIVRELETHRVCTSTKPSSDEVIGFHRALHWVLDLLT